MGEFPDSRTREDRGQISTPFGMASKVYCAGCGEHFGFAFGAEFMFYVCEGCAVPDPANPGVELPILSGADIAALTGR